MSVFSNEPKEELWLLRETSGQKPRAWALSLEMGVEALLEGWDTRETWNRHTKTAYLDPLTDRQGPWQWSRGCTTYTAGTRLSFLQITWPDIRLCLGRRQAALASPFFYSFSHLWVFVLFCTFDSREEEGEAVQFPGLDRSQPSPSFTSEAAPCGPLDCLRKWIQR